MKVIAFALLLCACGGAGGDASDAGADVVYGKKPIDATQGGFDASEADVPKTPIERMTPHQGITLSTPALHALYVGTPDVDIQTNRDTFISWLLASTDYWSILAQYKVGYGTLTGSSTIATSSFFQAGDVVDGVVNWLTLEERVRAAIAALPLDEGGVPNGYVVFLPNAVQVDLGDGSKTCADVGGYHSYDSVEAYAIIPSCSFSGTMVISHEVAEMSTDPIPTAGWYSEDDVQNAGGEVGDLCNAPVKVDGITVTQLWSNQDGDCEPPAD